MEDRQLCFSAEVSIRAQKLETLESTLEKFCIANLKLPVKPIDDEFLIEPKEKAIDSSCSAG